MKTSIELKNMRFYAYHGVFPQETVLGNEFEVSLTMDADITKACQTDNVEDTINYADVYDLVNEEMKIPSKLIEHVAHRIFEKVKNRYPQITFLKIRLAKLNPPVNGEVERSEVIICE